jgi:hypothetical protein
MRTSLALLAWLLLSGFNVGYTVVPTGSTGNSFTVNVLFAQGPYIMPRSGTLQSCSVWLRTAGGTSSFLLGLYGPLGVNQPGSLIATTATFATVVGWQTWPTTTHPVVAGGQVVWMGARDSVADGATQDSPTGTNLLNGTTVAGALTNPFTNAATLASSNWATGWYCTFTGDGGLPGKK